MTRSTSLPHVVIVGAGIVGAATAYYLSRAGARVTLLDAQTPSSGATGASDGAVSVASKRPGAMMRLAREARDLYAQLVKDEVLAGAFHSRPTYLFARTPEEVTLIHTQGKDLASEGEPTIALTRAELLNRIPGLGERVLAGLKVPQDGHAIGYQVVNRLLAAAQVAPHRHTPVRRLAVAHGRVIGVETDAGRILADRVVVAAGIDSGPLLGLSEVMIPRKGQLIVTDRAAMGGAAFPGPLMSAGYLAAKRATVPGQSSVNLVIDPLATGPVPDWQQSGRGLDRPADRCGHGCRDFARGAGRVPGAGPPTGGSHLCRHSSHHTGRTAHHWPAPHAGRPHHCHGHAG